MQLLVLYFSPDILDIIDKFVRVLMFISAIMALIYLYEGFKDLQSFVEHAGSGSTGALLILIYSILSLGGLIGESIELFIFDPSFLPFLGSLLIGNATYHIGLKYKDGIVRIGGIFMCIPILNILGYILAYVEFGNIIDTIRATSTQPTSKPTSNTGTLKGNVANIYVYSQSTAKILSAILEAVQLNAISVRPDMLVPGKNYITVTFPQPLPNLISSGSNIIKIKSYRIRLNLDNGSYIEVIVSYHFP
ncbi:DUF973 family protein [Acidianus sp. RZ1]|uniref:DUF973 family protein n=1 Tax=Acidianus sp. RZ1 TaxID=1540082 RepID=UPI001491EBDA|nr:DUF973 family protein [Acidianus sp. RZ1]NON63373.1 DUF973 family protein [Acidianus sp. RZ1]